MTDNRTGHGTGAATRLVGGVLSSRVASGDGRDVRRFAGNVRSRSLAGGILVTTKLMGSTTGNGVSTFSGVRTCRGGTSRRSGVSGGCAVPVVSVAMSFMRACHLVRGVFGNRDGMRRIVLGNKHNSVGSGF